jgi:hypothetical protein
VFPPPSGGGAMTDHHDVNQGSWLLLAGGLGGLGLLLSGFVLSASKPRG